MNEQFSPTPETAKKFLYHLERVENRRPCTYKERLYSATWVMTYGDAMNGREIKPHDGNIAVINALRAYHDNVVAHKRQNRAFNEYRQRRNVAKGTNVDQRSQNPSHGKSHHW
jgi:hypothetical protein